MCIKRLHLSQLFHYFVIAFILEIFPPFPASAAIEITEFEQRDSFRFIFMSDIHVQPELKADQGFEKAIAAANDLNPDFVITGGDLIMDALGEPYQRSVELYHLYEELCDNFKVPVYNTIGNHELFGLYLENDVDSRHPEYGKSIFKRRIGDGYTYFSFDHKGWHFIIIDSIEISADRRYAGLVDSIQIEWIRDDLKKLDRGTPIVLSIHIPFISVYRQVKAGGTAALKKNEVVRNSHQVIGLFDQHNLRLVLQGHLHVVEEIVYKGVHYITGGAVSGKWWKGPREDFPEGFMVIDVNGDDFNWTYRTYGWKAVEQ